MKITMTIDSLIKQHSLPLPDLIKIDVQGAEFDVLVGASNALEHANDVIIEIQDVEYNLDSPSEIYVLDLLEEAGFELVQKITKDNGVDGDYHFTKRKC